MTHYKQKKNVYLYLHIVIWTLSQEIHWFKPHKPYDENNNFSVSESLFLLLLFTNREHSESFVWESDYAVFKSLKT